MPQSALTNVYGVRPINASSFLDVRVIGDVAARPVLAALAQRLEVKPEAALEAVVIRYKSRRLRVRMLGLVVVVVAGWRSGRCSPTTVSSKAFR